MAGMRQSVLDYLHHLSSPAGAEALPDGELVRRFASEGDERAFRTLVQRHGPMILATCRRILHDVHEAEDCLQATFLVLARKARSIRNQESLAGWLFRVATHIALQARARLARQRSEELAAATLPRADSAVPESEEVSRLLGEELHQLPEKYQGPLILCYLEGKTHQTAARELSCPCGTMSRRLARGLELLRQRLRRRGLTLSVTALGLALAGLESRAAVAPALVDATTRVAGTGAGKVAGLAEAALRGLSWVRLKMTAFVLLTVAALGVGAVLSWPQPEPAPPRSIAQAEAAKALPIRDWGDPVHGVRLRCSCDRLTYRLDRDLIRVTFALHTVAATPQLVALEAENQEFTDVRLIDPDGNEHFVPGARVHLAHPRQRSGHLQHDSVHRVSMIIDPAKIGGGLQPGRYRLRGLFRRQPLGGGSNLSVADLRLESNETAFELRRGTLTPDDVPSGREGGGCALSLVGLRTTWKPGDLPLSFAVTLQRRSGDLQALDFLRSHRLGMYYHLEILDPQGQVHYLLQPALSAGVDPVADPFAHSRLMFLQLERIPVGKTLGERLDWSPAGDTERPYLLEPVVQSPRWSPGVHKVRAVYQLRDREEWVFGNHPDALRLVSNPLEVHLRGCE